MVLSKASGVGFLGVPVGVSVGVSVVVSVVVSVGISVGFSVVVSVVVGVSVIVSVEASGVVTVSATVGVFVGVSDGVSVVVSVVGGISFFFILVRPPRSQSLLIMVWCSSKTEHRLRIPLDSGPIFLRLTIFTVRRWYGSPFFLPPPLNLPGSLFPAIRPFPLSPLPPLRPCHLVASPPPFPSPAAFNSLSSVLRWPPLVDATNQTARSQGGGSGAPRSWCVTAQFVR